MQCILGVARREELGGSVIDRGVWRESCGGVDEAKCGVGRTRRSVGKGI